MTGNAPDRTEAFQKVAEALDRHVENPVPKSVWSPFRQAYSDAYAIARDAVRAALATPSSEPSVEHPDCGGTCACYDRGRLA